ncbi:MAG: hypothetical protein F6K03_17200, partial [Kamptonema sp. SIO4C4]|nr:hypothetical protein [Kamptonema sp. SIO4C4]
MSHSTRKLRKFPRLAISLTTLLLLTGGAFPSVGSDLENVPLLAQSETENPEPEESEEPEDVVVETENNPRFTCQTANGQYTVMYTPEE